MNGGLVDGTGYGGGLPDAYNKVKMLEEELDKAEKQSPKFEKVEGMPIRVRCNRTINDDRWRGEDIIEGTEIDIDRGYSVDWLLKEYPDSVTEIKMTKEDWIRLAVKEAQECKKRIENLRRRGIEPETIKYSGIVEDIDTLQGIYEIEITDGDLKVDPEDLASDYKSLKILKKEIEQREKVSPKYEVVKDMPVRVIFTKRIKNDRVNIAPGTITEVPLLYYEDFVNAYSGDFEEIKMTREDWIELATKEMYECKKKISFLEKISGKNFESYHISITHQDKVDGGGYGGGLSDAYHHLKYLQQDIAEFEYGLANDIDSRDGSEER